MKTNRRLVRIVCIVLALLMCVSIIIPLAYAFADTASTQKASDLKDEVKRLQDELDAINDQIKANEADITKQQQVKQYYQQQSNTIAAQIEAIKTDITNTEAALAQKQLEVQAKVLEVAHTKELFEQRLKAMYMTHNDSNLSTLLGVSSFSDALRYTENLQKMSESDTNLIEKLRTEQADLETQEAAVQTDLDSLNANKELLDQKSAEYAQSIQNANNAITAEEAEKEANEDAYADKKAQFEEAQKTWLSFVQANNVGFEYTGGTFAWPIPGYYTLSSDFGTVRVIYGVRDVHRGMDIPAPLGTKVYAAYDGQVSTVAHWSYGTCVKLDHGSGLVTIYGHLSARADGITDGVYVTKGQLIGYVGSTGNSTGNHLHFEVDLNGTPVSAWPYLNS